MGSPGAHPVREDPWGAPPPDRAPHFVVVRVVINVDFVVGVPFARLHFVSIFGRPVDLPPMRLGRVSLDDDYDDSCQCPRPNASLPSRTNLLPVISFPKLFLAKFFVVFDESLPSLFVGHCHDCIHCIHLVLAVSLNICRTRVR